MFIHPLRKGSLYAFDAVLKCDLRRHVAIGNDLLDAATRSETTKVTENGNDGYEHASHTPYCFSRQRIACTSDSYRHHVASPRLATTHAAKRPCSGPILQAVESSSLLPDSARIHIDFQTDGDFDDLRGFPGHFTSSLRLDGRLLADAAQRNCEDLGPRSQGEIPRRTALPLAPAKLGSKHLVFPIRTRPQNFVIAILVVEAGAVTH